MLEKEILLGICRIFIPLCSIKLVHFYVFLFPFPNWFGFDFSPNYIFHAPFLFWGSRDSLMTSEASELIALSHDSLACNSFFNLLHFISHQEHRESQSRILSITIIPLKCKCNCTARREAPLRLASDQLVDWSCYKIVSLVVQFFFVFQETEYIFHPQVSFTWHVDGCYLWTSLVSEHHTKAAFNEGLCCFMSLLQRLSSTFYFFYFLIKKRKGKIRAGGRKDFYTIVGSQHPPLS